MKESSSTYLLDLGINASPRYPPFTEAVMEVVRTGWQTKLWRSHHGYSSSNPVLKWAEENRTFDAIFGVLATPEHQKAARQIAREVISISSSPSFDDRISQVIFDPVAIGAMAADDLSRRGISAGLFYGLPHHHGIAARGRSYSDSLEKKGIPFLGSFEEQSKIPLREINNAKGPVGIFCGDDELAAKLSIFLEEQGISIPYKAFLLGVNDQEYLCHFGPVPLSSIRLDGPGMGKACCALLKTLATGVSPAKPHLEKVGPLGITTRASTDPSLLGDFVVSQAMAFLRQSPTIPGTVDDWAERTGSSRRPLEKRLRQILDQSPKQLLDAEKVRRSIYLLKNTRLGMEQIADQAGFSSGRHLRETLVRVEQKTPSEIREETVG